MRVRLLLAFLLVLGLLGSVAQADRPVEVAMRGPTRASSSSGTPGSARRRRPRPRGRSRRPPGQDRRYALANGCYSLRSPLPAVRRQGRGRLQRRRRVDRRRRGLPHAGHRGSARISSTAATATSWRPACSARSPPASGAGPDADWRVDNAAGGAFTIVLPSQNKALGVAAGRLVLTDPAGAGAFTFEPAQGCAVYPEVETSRHRQAVHEPDAVGRGEGHDRPPPARHGVRVPRRQGALRQAVVSLRRALRARRLPRPPGRERLRRRPRERPLRQPGALPRPGRLADLQGLAEPRLAHPRADLLQVDRARVHGRAARDREPVRREQAALRALSASSRTTATRWPRCASRTRTSTRSRTTSTPRTAARAGAGSGS